MIVAFALMAILVASQGGPAVAITFDDLPAAGAMNPDRDPALSTRDIQAINAAILTTLRAHRVPSIGFVNERGIAESADAEVRRKVLSDWIDAGMDLGNHTYSHADFNRISVEAFRSEIGKGELSIAPLMRKAGKRLAWFRFPMNHTGDTREKHDAAARQLAWSGYRLATCTIENEDYEFERAFRVALSKHDEQTAAKLRAAYLQYTAAEIDYYAALHRQLFGRPTAQVMLLHVNRLNAELLDDILRMFESRGYYFVTLAEAQADPAFATPETYVTKFGPMWGYRWAAVLHAKVDGSKEPEPPDWIGHYGQKADPAR